MCVEEAAQHVHGIGEGRGECVQFSLSVRDGFMSDVKIECPNCHKSFKLNETLAAPLVEETRRKFQAEFEEKEEALEERRKAFADEQKTVEKSRKELEKERAALLKQKEQISEQVAELVEQQKVVIGREEAKKAKQKYDEKLAEREEEKAELQEQIKEKDEKLAEARKQEVEFRKKQRELDDKIKGAEVELEKRLNESLAPEREKAKKEAEEQQRLKIAEKDKIIDDQKLKLAEAQRKLEQGSQQLQGEVHELDIERRLREAFPRDTIEPVPTGQHGGDALHRVLAAQGQCCGTILWECKRTKAWQGGWPDKLKQDQRAAKADLAVIVTQAMPKGLDSFAEVEGVWVTSPILAISLGAALRLCVLECFMARRAADGQHDKMAILYQYLTGPEFRRRIEALKDAFVTMQDDLNSERRVLTKQWEKRQKQIDRVMVSTVGMYGDLQAIAGTTLQEIEGLELKTLPVATDAD